MARTFYSEYVRHCLRFYARHPNPTFSNETDKENWLVCDKVLKSLSDGDRKDILSIYRDGDTVPDNIYNLSKKKGIKQDSLWKLINDIERKVAKGRRLI